MSGRHWRSLISIAVALLASAALASEAGAFIYYHVDAPAAGKREFSLIGLIKPGKPKPVTAFFSSKNLSAYTGYSARSASRATRKRIRARIPRLGHVAVRFHEQRKRRDVDHLIRDCRLVSVRHIGRYTGIVNVRGDGGYAGVDRRSARGGYERVDIRGCNILDLTPRAPASSRIGLLTSCDPRSRVGFLAVGGAARSAFAASSSERLGRLRIDRYASTEKGGKGAFRIGSGYDSAHVEPPGPYFDGSAVYENGKLTGDLTASFIGAADLPLTPGDARLTDVDGPVVSRRCAPYLPLRFGDVTAATRLGFPRPYLSRAVISK